MGALVPAAGRPRPRRLAAGPRRGADIDPGVGPRWLQIAVAVVAGFFALVSVGLTVFGITVLATNGAAADLPGVGPREWALVCLSTFAIGINTWSAVQLVRRGTLF